jgi:DNA-binding MarR family transcriptional regulator
VSLSVSGTPSSEPGDPAIPPTEPPRGSEPFARDAAIDDLVDEMTAWKPRERISAIRSWLKGSLSLIHLHVLSAIEADGPQPMSRLADMLDVSVASATGIVSRMEERNLVERQHDRQDRRVVLVVPTEAGLAVFRTMNEQRRDRLRLLLGRLTDDELEGLRRGLRAIRVAREALQGEMTAESADGGPDERRDRAGRSHR